MIEDYKAYVKEIRLPVPCSIQGTGSLVVFSKPQIRGSVQVHFKNEWTAFFSAVFCACDNRFDGPRLDFITVKEAKQITLNNFI